MTSSVGAPPIAFSWSSVLSYLAPVLVLALTYFLYHRLTRPDWTQYGVKHVQLSTQFLLDVDFRGKFSKLLEDHGDTVGFNVGSQLRLITCDISLIKDVLVKDFNNFVDRGEQLRSNSPFAKSLFFARANEWRHHRQIVSPTFTSGKLKVIFKTVDSCARELAEYLQGRAERGEIIAVREPSAKFTGQVIARTAFGLNVNFINDTDSEFFNYAQTLLHPRMGWARTVFTLLNFVPHLIDLCLKLFPSLQFFDSINLEANAYFRSVLKATFEERRRLTKSRTHSDFLDLILRANEEAEAGKLDSSEEELTPVTVSGPVRSLSDEEILGHSMLIIFAGMETSAATLQMCLCEMALNPDVQERVYQEIQTVVRSASPTYEQLGQLTYTEQVINETLRLYSPAPVVDRLALQTKTYGDVTIPEGAVVVIPYYHIMRDPRIYSNPTHFDPDRFAPEDKEKRDPLTFPAFGQGPRLCLGKRLALLELKTALVHIVKRMKVKVTEQTEPRQGTRGEDIQLKLQGVTAPVKPVRLSFELRDGLNNT